MEAVGDLCTISILNLQVASGVKFWIASDVDVAARWREDHASIHYAADDTQI